MKNKRKWHIWRRPQLIINKNFISLLPAFVISINDIVIHEKNITFIFHFAVFHARIGFYKDSE